MAKKEPTGWITVNGVHVPVFEGESNSDAYNRAIAKQNEDKKQKDIAKREEEVKKLNGSVATHKEVKGFATSRDDINKSNVDDMMFSFGVANNKVAKGKTDDTLNSSYRISDSEWSSAERTQFAKEIREYVKKSFPNLDYSIAVVSKSGKDGGVWVKVKNNKNSKYYI